MKRLQSRFIDRRAGKSCALDATSERAGAYKSLISARVTIVYICIYTAVEQKAKERKGISPFRWYTVYRIKLNIPRCKFVCERDILTDVLR